MENNQDILEIEGRINPDDYQHRQLVRLNGHYEPEHRGLYRIVAVRDKRDSRIKQFNLLEPIDTPHWNAYLESERQRFLSDCSD